MLIWFIMLTTLVPLAFIGRLTEWVIKVLGRPAGLLALESPLSSFSRAGSFITTNDGVRLYYEDAGPCDLSSSSSTIVLVHGAGCSLRWWNRSFEALSQQSRVVAVDLRGCGRSDKPMHGEAV